MCERDIDCMETGERCGTILVETCTNSDTIFLVIGQQKDVIIAQLATQVALRESELKDARDLAERATTELERWRNTAQSVQEQEEAILYLLAKQGWHVCIVLF
jgi:hypothetical protein